MYLSGREVREVRRAAAYTGPVTVPGDPAGAYLEGERREIAVYAPGGYHWVPGTGDEVLVLKAGPAGEKPCAVGVASPRPDLEPGEVLIEAGGTSILLGRKGRVLITGELLVNGKAVQLESGGV